MTSSICSVVKSSIGRFAFSIILYLAFGCASATAYGHMARKNEIVTKSFTAPDGKTIKKEVELFTWEKLDYVDKVKEAFNI